MAIDYTQKDINSLIINKVPTQTVYNKMVEQNLINDDELYLIQDNEVDIDAVVDTAKTEMQTYTDTAVSNAKDAINLNITGTVATAKKNVEDNIRLKKNVDCLLPSTSSWSSICYGQGKYIAVARKGYYPAYSTDGVFWKITNMLYPADDWCSICYGGGKFVVVGNSQSNIAYSIDGLNWTAKQVSSSTKWQSVCYGNGKFVAIAYGSSNMAYSSDGINWTLGTMPSALTWKSVCYGNGKFVAIAYGSSNMAYSSDGINWTLGTMPSASNWQSVCYGNGKFVAVASDGTSSAYSSDGISWTSSKLTSFAEWSTVVYGFNVFVAISGLANSSNTINFINYSYDGITWKKVYLPKTQAWTAITSGSTEFVMLATNSDISLNSKVGTEWSSTSTVNKVEYSELSTEIQDKFDTIQNKLNPSAHSITLTVSGWNSSTKTQTVSCNGILADETAQLIIPMPASASKSTYEDAGISLTAQGANSLTFTASTVPTSAITVYVVYQELNYS